MHARKRMLTNGKGPGACSRKPPGPAGVVSSIPALARIPHQASAQSPQLQYVSAFGSVGLLNGLF
jgi:hypothetical protein